MSSRPAYAPDLARYVEAHWPRATPLTVPLAVLEEALSTAFHASLTSEEGRPTRFRLLLTPAEALPAGGTFNEGVLRLMFERSRGLSADELRRLAPAVAFDTSLIGAHTDDSRALRIWGVAHSGPAWLAPTWGGRDVVPNWTFDPIIHVTAPGHVAVRCAGKLVGALERGVLVDAMMDVFQSEWFPKLFEREREEVRAKHAARQANAESPTLAEHSLVVLVGQQMLRRAIRLIRNAGHGGMLLILDRTDGDADHLQSIRLKYSIAQDEPSHRYHGLLLRILEVIAASTSKTSVGWADFVANASPELAKLEQAVFEWSRVIANLAAIDGAVVLDKRLGVLAFGAEVKGELPLNPRVWRALDTEGHQRRPDEVESVGTRHRAAYRFVNEHPRGLAVVVSHDGNVSFVANQDGEIVVWEQSMGP